MTQNTPQNGLVVSLSREQIRSGSTRVHDHDKLTELFLSALRIPPHHCAIVRASCAAESGQMLLNLPNSSNPPTG